jgi:hypothetical protein
VIKLASVVLTASAAVLMSGCVVAPLPPRHVVRIQQVIVEPVYAPPAGVVYVQPTYAIPAPGYVWQYHANFGWGWRHPNYGWHGGWR